MYKNFKWFLSYGIIKSLNWTDALHYTTQVS